MQKELELNFDLPEPKPFRERFRARMSMRPGINAKVVLARMNGQQPERERADEPAVSLLVFEAPEVSAQVSLF